MPDVIAFEDAIEATKGENRRLLIGNGFSAHHFNYETLLEKAGLDSNGPLRALFTQLSTVDFEVVIRALEDASLVERTYNKIKRAELLQQDADKLRRALVHAIRQIHPANREDVEGLAACVKFLKQFNALSH